MNDLDKLRDKRKTKYCDPLTQHGFEEGHKVCRMDEVQPLIKIVEEGIEGQKCRCFPYSEKCFYCRTKRVLERYKVK